MRKTVFFSFFSLSLPSLPSSLFLFYSRGGRKLKYASSRILELPPSRLSQESMIIQRGFDTWLSRRSFFASFVMNSRGRCSWLILSIFFSFFFFERYRGMKLNSFLILKVNNKPLKIVLHVIFDYLFIAIRINFFVDLYILNVIFFAM